MSSPFLRRTKLVSLAVLDSERDLQDTDPFSTLYISPCQIKVSNDPFEEIPFEDIIPCNRTSYKCPTNVISRTELEIIYDYEIHYVTGADFDVTLDALEGAQLQHAAALTGLLNCGATSIERGGPGRSLQEASLLTEDESNALISISSFPPDAKDPQFTECIVPVQASVSAGTTCTPVKGSITASIDSSASGPVEDGILRGMMRVARVGMADDIYVSGNIRKVSFIGARADQDLGFAPDSARDVDTDGDDGGDLSSVGVAFIVIGSVLLFALIALFTVRKRRRDQEEQGMEFHDATIEAKELKASAVMMGQQNFERQASMEGADIPGSLANADELALLPSISGSPTKTGDVDDIPEVVADTPIDAPEEALSLGSSVDYLSDTGTNFDMSSVDTGTENQSLDTDMSIDTARSAVVTAAPAAVVDQLNVISESGDVIANIEDEDSFHELQRIV